MRLNIWKWESYFFFYLMHLQVLKHLESKVQLFLFCRETLTQTELNITKLKGETVTASVVEHRESLKEKIMSLRVTVSLFP